MAISPDVLATALNELMPNYSEMFTKWHPLLDNVVKNGNMDKKSLKGPLREFAVVTDGPGQVTQINTGSELINGGRRQNGYRGNVKAPRMIYAFDVPGKDLAEANGEQDLAKILQNYPELALSDFHERIATQLGTGNGSQVGGFVTFNGQTTFNPDGSARNGLFLFAAPDSQTATVHNLVSQGGASGIPGWYNQYQDVTSFQNNGRARLRKAFYAASREGSKMTGAVDLMLGDEQSFLNYIEDLDEQVRVASIVNDTAPGQVRQGIKFLTANFYLDDAIDISASTFTGDAQDGVIYGLKTSTWEGFTLGHDSGKETKGDFAVRGPHRIPDQDAWRYEIVLSMGLHTTQRRCNFAVTGCATP